MAVATASLVLLMALAPPAAANIEPSTYQVVIAKFDGLNTVSSGGFATCPAGTKIVTGGARTRLGNFGFFPNLSSSTPTFDGNGWYAAGVAPSGTQLTVLLLCAPAVQVADATLLTRTVRNPNSVIFTDSRRCPLGTTIYGGGGFFHEPFTAPDPKIGGQIFASMPSGNGWFFGGFNSPSFAMTLSARCSPNIRIQFVKTVTETFDPGTDLLTGGFVRCPAGLRAYSGGAWWHTATSTNPSFTGVLMNSLPTSGAGGWFANGRGTGRLSVTVRCTPV